MLFLPSSYHRYTCILNYCPNVVRRESDFVMKSRATATRSMPSVIAWCTCSTARWFSLTWLIEFRRYTSEILRTKKLLCRRPLVTTCCSMFVSLGTVVHSWQFRLFDAELITSSNAWLKDLVECFITPQTFEPSVCNLHCGYRTGKCKASWLNGSVQGFQQLNCRESHHQAKSNVTWIDLLQQASGLRCRITSADFSIFVQSFAEALVLIKDGLDCSSYLS